MFIFKYSKELGYLSTYSWFSFTGNGICKQAFQSVLLAKCGIGQSEEGKVLDAVCLSLSLSSYCVISYSTSNFFKNLVSWKGEIKMVSLYIKRS